MAIYGSAPDAIELRRRAAIGDDERMAERSMAMALAAAGDLTGNWSWTVWLLIPLVLVLAYVTARCVGPRGDPPRSRTASRGVSHYLDDSISRKDAE